MVQPSSDGDGVEMDREGGCIIYGACFSSYDGASHRRVLVDLTNDHRSKPMLNLEPVKRLEGITEPRRIEKLDGGGVGVVMAVGMHALDLFIIS